MIQTGTQRVPCATMRHNTPAFTTGRAICLLAIAASTPSHAQVDGFNKGKGNMDLVGSLGYEQGLGYFLAEGSIPLKRVRLSVGLFAARGITDDFDVQLSIPFISTSGTSGVQDGQIFLKWLPVKARTGKGKITFGPAIGGSAPLTDYQTEGLGAIGQQATSLIPMGVLQYTHDNGWFFSVVGGQVVTEAPTPDALIGTLRVGRAWGKAYWEVYAQGQEAYGGKDYLGVGEQAPSTFRELGVDYLKAGGKYYRRLGERFGWVGELGYVLSGRNVDQGLLLAGGFVVHFRK